MPVFALNPNIKLIAITTKIRQTDAIIECKVDVMFSTANFDFGCLYSYK